MPSAKCWRDIIETPRGNAESDLNANQFPPASPEKRDENWFDLKAWSDTTGRGRTDTLLRVLDFESSASANSATVATLVPDLKFRVASCWQREILNEYSPGVKLARALSGAALVSSLKIGSLETGKARFGIFEAG